MVISYLSSQNFNTSYTLEITHREQNYRQKQFCNKKTQVILNALPGTDKYIIGELQTKPVIYKKTKHK